MNSWSRPESHKTSPPGPVDFMPAQYVSHASRLSLGAERDSLASLGIIRYFCQEERTGFTEEDTDPIYVAQPSGRRFARLMAVRRVSAKGLSSVTLAGSAASKGSSGRSRPTMYSTGSE